MSEPAFALPLFLLAMGGAFLSFLLFGVFAVVTVRKLRKNPQTRFRLGMPLYPGGEIPNVAAAIALPRSYTRWVRSGPMGDLFADCDAVYAHTTRLDRWLARIFFSVFLVSVTLVGSFTIVYYLW